MNNGNNAYVNNNPNQGNYGQQQNNPNYNMNFINDPQQYSSEF